MAELGVKVDYSLNVMEQARNLNDLSSLIISKVGNIIREVMPTLLIVQGDTCTAMSSAIAAFHEKTKP
ncbi:hypothetical protein EBT31_21645 [bacterium]|nr:hypothetical protein [bacterium]